MYLVKEHKNTGSRIHKGLGELSEATGNRFWGFLPLAQNNGGKVYRPEKKPIPLQRKKPHKKSQVKIHWGRRKSGDIVKASFPNKRKTRAEKKVPVQRRTSKSHNRKGRLSAQTLNKTPKK